jgi:hypothetical protein
VTLLVAFVLKDTSTIIEVCLPAAAEHRRWAEAHEVSFVFGVAFTIGYLDLAWTMNLTTRCVTPIQLLEEDSCRSCSTHIVSIFAALGEDGRRSSKQTRREPVVTLPREDGPFSDAKTNADTLGASIDKLNDYITAHNDQSLRQAEQQKLDRAIRL